MNDKGLSKKEVEFYRNKYGKNEILFRKKNTIFKLFIESFSDPIIRILLIALFLKILFLFDKGDLFETIGIAISVFLASFISVISEYGSEVSFEKLSKENSNVNVKVVRNGIKCIIPIEEVVVNDIVLVESGDRVCADGNIIYGNVSIDESSISGESIEKLKNLNDFVYMGSVVCEGSCYFKVSGVGVNTFYGKIAKDVQEEPSVSPLKLKLSKLAKVISIIGYVGAFLVFVSYMINVDYGNGSFFSHLLYGITLSVAVIVMAVPEGLPMMISLVLSSNMKRLIKKNVLVKKMVGIETSGSLNILFTDKTGTLTEGNLVVEKIIDAELNDYYKYEDLVNKDIFYMSLVYNNDSFFSNGVCEGGNITDRAILNFVHSDDKSKYEILDNIKFNSKNKYSGVKTSYSDYYFYKGAFEVILENSIYYLKSDGSKRVFLEKDIMKDKLLKYTEEGYRIIGIGMGEDFSHLILIGFVLIKDNIRKEAKEGIDLIKSANIQVVMVTGDNSSTALSIAKKLGIYNEINNVCLTSEEFNKMSDEEVKKILPRLSILSRSLPFDKNRLVRLAQELDLVCGMTGDGVNDSPALKRADVGFAMGSGSDIAKEVSDIVILDNNISSIVSAILYGRTIFKSIRKFVMFQLTVNLCTVLLSIVGPFIGILSPITVIQVLWVNMVMDTFAALAFSYEPALEEYMNEKPKCKNEQIINKYMLNQIIINGIYSFLLFIFFLKSPLILSLYRFDISDKYLMTAFFGLFIFIDIFNAFASRTHRINTFANLFKNKIFLIIFIFIICIQVLLIYYGGDFFRTTGLSVCEFFIMLFLASSVLVIDLIRKIILKRKKLLNGV